MVRVFVSDVDTYWGRVLSETLSKASTIPPELDSDAESDASGAEEPVGEPFEVIGTLADPSNPSGQPKWVSKIVNVRFL
jgi:hypothetical protein